MMRLPAAAALLVLISAHQAHALYKVFLPEGRVGTAYRVNLPTPGAIVDGTVPDGLTLSANGVLSGTPTRVGTFNFTVANTVYSIRVVNRAP